MIVEGNCIFYASTQASSCDQRHYEPYLNDLLCMVQTHLVYVHPRFASLNFVFTILIIRSAALGVT